MKEVYNMPSFMAVRRMYNSRHVLMEKPPMGTMGNLSAKVICWISDESIAASALNLHMVLGKIPCLLKRGVAKFTISAVLCVADRIVLVIRVLRYSKTMPFRLRCNCIDITS